MRVLVLFSDPPEQARLRLDKEARHIHLLAQKHEGIDVQFRHATEITDIYSELAVEDFTVIQFSGHGSPDGIYLDRSNLQSDGELVSATRLVSVLGVADRQPLVAIFLSCYSRESIHTLAEAAPFVITAVGEIDDETSIQFVGALYQGLFTGQPVQVSFDNAIRRLQALELPTECIRIDRRAIVKRGDSRFIEIRPSLRHDSILLNLDLVADTLGRFGMPEEVLCHLLARKLSIHFWIFSTPRERCLIPIGKLLFGEFRWEDANDFVECTRFVRLEPDIDPERWAVWHRLLVAYNDLASSTYRSVDEPASPAHQRTLTRAVNLLAQYVRKYLDPSLEPIERLGFKQLIPLCVFVKTHAEDAVLQLDLERYEAALKDLELALTSFHEVVDGLQPPEDLSSDGANV